MIKNLTKVLVTIAVTLFSISSFAADRVKFSPDHTGVMVIDAQKSFIPGYPEFWPPIAPEPEVIKPSIDRIEKLMTLSGQKQFQLFVTYETNTWEIETGPVLMPDHLEALKPENTIIFKKQSFNVVDHSNFADQVRQTGLSKMVIAGAETDICVLETVLGLLKMGIEVYVLEDSVYTSEFNYKQALIRMEQAGARLINYEDFEKSVQQDKAIKIKSKYVSSKDPRPSVLSVRNGKTAFIVMDIQKAAMDQVSPKNKAEMALRLRQQIIDAYVYDIPLIMVNDPALENVLPDNFVIVPDSQLSEYDRTKKSIAKIQGLTDELYGKGIEQVVLAGISKDGSIYKSAIGLVKAGFEVFLMEDALLSRSAGVNQEKKRMKAYKAGVIPFTYKVEFFEVTGGVDYHHWDWKSPRNSKVWGPYNMIDPYNMNPVLR